MLLEQAALTADDAFDRALQRGVERGHDTRRLRIRQIAEHHADEVRRKEAARLVGEAETLGARDRGRGRWRESRAAPSGQHDSLARSRLTPDCARD